MTWSDEILLAVAGRLLSRARWRDYHHTGDPAPLASAVGGSAVRSLQAECGAEGEKVAANIFEARQLENPHVGRERLARL